MRGGTPHAAAPSPPPSAAELHELIVDYLSDLARSSPSNQPLEAATQLLREAFSLSSRPPPSPRRPSLWDLYAQAAAAGAVRRLAPEPAAAPRPDATGDFDRFLLELHRRGFFDGASSAAAQDERIRHAEGVWSRRPSRGDRQEAARREELADWAARREELDARVDAEPHGEELAELLVLRATALLHLHDLSAAAQDAEAAAQLSELDNTRAVALSRAGVAYEALGQFSQAISRGYQPALALDPTNELLILSLQQARMKAHSGRDGAPTTFVSDLPAAAHSD